MNSDQSGNDGNDVSEGYDRGIAQGRAVGAGSDLDERSKTVIENTALADKKPTRRARGVRTRRQILDAALKVIAKNGLRGMTHRAVAKEAAVNLSLTTYYFKDLDDLISQAFDHYAATGGEKRRHTWQVIFDRLESIEPAALTRPADRKAIVDHMVVQASEYIRHQLRGDKTRLAVEASYYFDPQLPKAVQNQVQQHMALMTADFVRVCTIMSTTAPNVDGALLFGAVQRLEFEGLGLIGDGDLTFIDDQIDRIIRLIMG